MAGVTQVVNSLNKRLITLPVSGAGSDIAPGALLMKGATAGTDLGVAIPVTATSNLGALGVLNELHDYSVTGDATTATLVYWFAPFTAAPPSHPIEIFDTATLIAVDYSQASTVAVVSNTTTTVVVTSFEDGFDGGFIYVNAGAGIGQIEFVQASSSGNITIPATPGTALTSTSKLTKVLPLFHDKPVWKISTTTAGTLLDSTAAIGTGRAVNVGNYIQLNGLITVLDPKAYNNRSGLDTSGTLRLFSHLQMVSTAFHPLS